MKIGMNLLLWTGRVGEEHFPLLGQLREMGYDGVELPLFDRDDAHYRRVRAELERAGLECTAVTITNPETNPIGPDPAVRRAAVDMLRERVDTLHLLGGRVLCGPLHSALGQMAGRGRTEEEWNWCVESLRQVAEHAGQAEVVLGLEALNRFELYFLNTAADARRLVDAVGHPNLRAMYDSFHANIEENSIPEAVRSLGDTLAHVHISENHRGIPGTGLVQWDETFAALRAAGYDEWLTIEAFGHKVPELAAATCIWRPIFESEEQLAREGLAFIRRRWGTD